ncbi:MFS transporter [Orrella sp. 11846]|uniref:MFS transporter n=1 Tax=Orrella sp. 11846 TaxID=3409913 RepID=UPI003B59FDF4
MSPVFQRWLILAIVSVALFLIVVDVTVLYLALPALTHDLQASASQKLWIVNAYALAVAALLPSTGTLGDRLGHKQLFVYGMMVFGVASLLAAFSPSATVLISSRVLLGLGAAMMMPSTLAIIRIVFEDPQQRALAIGIWASIASGGAAVGPIVGGFLLEYFWWGSVFLVNVPIILIALPIAYRFIPTIARNPNRAFDGVAAIAVMIALVTFTLGIKTLGNFAQEWPLGILLLVISVLAAWGLHARQRHTGQPLLDFALFHHPVFRAGCATAVTATAVLLGMELAITQRFQLVYEMSAWEAGLSLLPIPVSAFLVGPISGHYLHRIGVHRTLWLSLLIAGVGFTLYALTLHATLVVQFVGFVFIGIGIGAAMTAASNAMLLNAPLELSGMAASIEEVSYEMGAALGVAVLGSLLMVIYNLSFDVPASLSLSAEQSAQIAHHIDSAVDALKHLTGTQAQALRQQINLAFDQAVLWVTWLSAVALFLISAWIYRLRTKSQKLR